jgi:hypothetical protein
LSYFTHIDAPMRAMAQLLRAGSYADEVMPMAQRGDFAV